MLLTCSSADIGGERKIPYMSNLPTAWRKRYVFRAASERAWKFSKAAPDTAPIESFCAALAEYMRVDRR